jgi:hypothetical protein
MVCLIQTQDLGSLATDTDSYTRLDSSASEARPGTILAWSIHERTALQNRGQFRRGAGK